MTILLAPAFFYASGSDHSRLLKVCGLEVNRFQVVDDKKGSLDSAENTCLVKAACP